VGTLPEMGRGRGKGQAITDRGGQGRAGELQQ